MGLGVGIGQGLQKGLHIAQASGFSTDENALLKLAERARMQSVLLYQAVVTHATLMAKREPAARFAVRLAQGELFVLS